MSRASDVFDLIMGTFQNLLEREGTAGATQAALAVQAINKEVSSFSAFTRDNPYVETAGLVFGTCAVAAVGPEIAAVSAFIEAGVTAVEGLEGLQGIGAVATAAAGVAISDGTSWLTDFAYPTDADFLGQVAQTATSQVASVSDGSPPYSTVLLPADVSAWGVTDAGSSDHVQYDGSTFTPTGDTATIYSTSSGVETDTSNSSGVLVSTDIENSNGTSQITVYNPDGSSVSTYYTGPNGTGSVVATASTNNNNQSTVDFSAPNQQILISNNPNDSITFNSRGLEEEVDFPFGPAPLYSVGYEENYGAAPYFVNVQIDYPSGQILVLSFPDLVKGQWDFSTKILQSGEEVLAIDFQSVACFRSGTKILTMRGHTPVEEIDADDLVYTQFSGFVRLKWVGRRYIDCRRHPKPQQVWPVRVSASAFGEGMPHRDLWLSSDHAVFVDEALIPIKHLTNGTSIEQVPMDEITYYHIELEHHDVLLAEGLPVESYLDTGDRFNFENGGGSITLHPDFSARRWDIALIWEALGCAPLIVTGPALEAARKLVNSCASMIRSVKDHVA